MDLYWKDEQRGKRGAEARRSYLYAGVWDKPVACIFRSNKGVMWTSLYHVPTQHEGRDWRVKEVMQQIVEEAVRIFFDMANTNRPAKELQPEPSLVLTGVRPYGPPIKRSE